MSEDFQRSSADPGSQALSDEARDFFLGLPQQVYPAALIEAYPRIAMAIFERRKTPVALARYFDTLLHDERGGRRGFEFGLMIELTNLKEALCGSIVNPDNTDPFWGQPGSRRGERDS